MTPEERALERLGEARVRLETRLSLSRFIGLGALAAAIALVLGIVLFSH